MSEAGIAWHRTANGHVLDVLETQGFLTIFCAQCKIELSRVWIPGPCRTEVEREVARQRMAQFVEQGRQADDEAPAPIPGNKRRHRKGNRVPEQAVESGGESGGDASRRLVEPDSASD